ncbi:putative chaperone protein dnaK [Candidatus Protochlamydia naegleriophila]|uniref:Putative chaperone protein dnaK n=1 Tax=Candidatus Protochlamydia naegleriophila TaxID=389348 RepID=A0A0U5K777_9BACT|nr:Hsp70 family protein [Candidatus Protochlamydia naegleriophila]CUI18027.1 putative chaperone protein dnaK [Candidatus Protochlamydia naegleriophila]
MSTIEIGIDLGTTNSSVAVIQNNETQILKNALGEESTPSVVYADRNGNIVIGSKARRVMNNSKENLQNSKAEVKRLMGTGESIFFPNLKKALLPEEVSAEILKALRGDVQRKHPEMALDAAVITVPAYFSTVQSEATKRAGNLAGFKQVVLLQEPIAAAIAYGFLNQKNENWLVYDLGGGTFDVALVALRDGSLTVLAHAGDNFLGGKDFDAAIIQNLIQPSLVAEGILLDPVIHSQIFSYLKELAETAKIELTISEKTTIDIDIQTDQIQIQHSIEISRLDLLESCKDLLGKTADLCKKTIDDSKVEPSTVQKIVLVGGPTQMPILREFLRDALQIKVDGSLDPLTVVAKGAAMFGNQTAVSVQENKTGRQNADCQLEVNYNPVTSDDEQTITGKIAVCQESSQPYSIQFAGSDDSFSSEEILIKNGKFILTLPTGAKGTQYWIYIKDSSGKLIASSPDSIHIARGVSIMGAPLPYSIGVSILSLSALQGYADASETMEFFFSKNSILPLKEKKRFHTVADLKAGSSDNGLPICIYEGESLITNRNTLVCHLAITGKSIAKDLKRGSPVDITIQINESRELSVTAYLPESDITINARQTLYFDAAKIDEVKKDFSEQISRSEAVIGTEENSKEVGIIKNMIKDIQATIDRSGSDSDQQRKAEKQVKDLMMALDQMEAKTKYNANVAAFWRECDEISEYLQDCNPPEKRTEYETTYNTLRKEGLSAIAKQDAVWIEHIAKKLDELHFRCQFSDPRILASWMQYILQQAQEKQNPHPSLPALISRAQDALAKSDIKEMQEVFWAIRPFIWHGKTQVKFVKSGIML